MKTQIVRKLPTGGISVFAAFALLLGIAVPATAGQSNLPPGNLGNPDIVPPQARFGGLTYSEWSARFVQWMYSLPITHHPLFDNADCSTGQTGNVWFIEGKRGGDEPFPPGGRHCTIPPGTALFLAVAARTEDNTRCNGQNIDPTTKPESQLRQEAAANLNSFLDSRVVIIDNVPVKGLPNCNPEDPSTCESPYRVQSPFFDYTNVPAEDNLIALDAGSCYSDPTGTGEPFNVPGVIADGLYVMIKPLPVANGKVHTIQFGPIGPDGNPTRKYNITVGPKKKGFQ